MSRGGLRMFLRVGTFVLMALFFGTANAQLVETEGVQSFSQGDAWKRADAQPAGEKIEPLQRFYADLGDPAMENIINAEQVFCYEIFPRNKDYKGYTINGFPIRGFCGVLSDQVKNLFGTHFLMEPKNINFNNLENCVVEPKILVRFIKGVDSTDVLLSSPCHSFAIFYAGKVAVYNFTPGAEMIDAMVAAFSSKHAEFVSPALLNQLMPIGVVQDDQQRKLVNKRSEPIRKWEEGAIKREEQKEAVRQKNNTGWNKLKSLNVK